MNLFFDTECANCNNHIAKICEFGYVLTDDNLNIIETNNLLINPQDKFNTYGFKKAGIQLSYKTCVYQSSPTIKERYLKIKSLLTDPNTVVYGFSTQSDADYIMTDFKRNNLPQINFDFYDIKTLFEIYLGKTGKLSLDSIYEESGMENGDIVHHEARNDAFMTLACFKYFLKLSNKSPKDIKGNYPLAYGELFNNRIVFGGVVFNYTKGNRVTQNNKKILTAFIDSCQAKTELEGVFGKTFCFEREYEKQHFAEVLLVSKKILEGGGKMTSLLYRGDYIIVSDDLKYKGSLGKKQKIINLSRLLKMLSISPKTFNEHNIDVDLILSKMPQNVEWYKQYQKHIKKKKSPAIS